MVRMDGLDSDRASSRGAGSSIPGSEVPGFETIGEESREMSKKDLTFSVSQPGSKDIVYVS